MADDCKPILDSCPPGHEMQQCRIGQTIQYKCEQCSPFSFQPNENRLGDKCRLRKGCTKPFMEYKKKGNARMYGTTTEDAACDCQMGYHFENVDQRACVPNIICDKGFGIGIYGLCEDCLSKNMYSNKSDNKQKCSPLRNCEKEGRCTVKKSNGTYDNECGPIVKDVNYCDTMRPNQFVDSSGDQNSNIIIYASVFGSVFLVMVIVLVVLLIWKGGKKKYKEEPLTQEQLDDIKVRMLDQTEKDNDFSVTVLHTLFRVIEDRIDKQMWSLAQELFKEHPQTGKYEVLVQLYKNTEQKYAVNGYLQHWKSWKGENSESVHHLVSCLQCCKRDDIVYEVCNRLSPELGVNQKKKYGNNRRTDKSDCMQDFILNIFPCMDDRNRLDGKSTREQETSATPLRQQDQEAVVFQDSSPSAPPMNGDPDCVTFQKEYSVPVQASS